MKNQKNTTQFLFIQCQYNFVVVAIDSIITIES